MQEVPLPFSPGLALWSLVMFLVFALLIGGAIALLKKLAHGNHRLVVAPLLMAGILMLGVLLLFFARSSHDGPAQVAMTSPPLPAMTPMVATASKIVRPESTTSTAARESPIETTLLVPENPSAESTVEVAAKNPADKQLPEWTKLKLVLDGKHKLVVVNGGRFASEEEAELHAFDQAAAVAAQEFRRFDPRGLGNRLEIHRDIVRQNAVKYRFLEEREHDFGKSKGLMYQVWLQIELSPELRERFAAPWRQATIDARIRTLAGWGIWLTVAAGVIAFAFRLDSARQGRSRASLCVMVGILAAGSLLLMA